MLLFGKGKAGRQIELVVRGMTCEHCEMRVKKALLGVDGVVDARVSRAREEAVVTLDPAAEAPAEGLAASLVDAVRNAGYEAEWPEK